MVKDKIGMVSSGQIVEDIENQIKCMHYFWLGQRDVYAILEYEWNYLTERVQVILW